jgi:LysR family transcriptional regulator, regulator for bpeEF and oprC
METIELDLTRVFVKVVQNGSFSRTAQLLKLPKSTVSKSISRLERETGTKLLLRTTRSLSLTAAGRAFFDATVGAISTLEEAQKSLYGSDSILNGQVRITAPEDLGSLVIAPIVAELALQNAGLGFELHYTDDVLDLVKDGFDLAVRVGRLAESGFKMKRVGEVVLIPVATKEYLKRYDKIRHPQDLSEHLCGSLNRQALLGHWTLRSSKGTVCVPIRARVSSNQMTSLLKVAQSGCGIALVPHYMAKPLLDSGELVRVLPEWSSPGLPVSVVTPLSPSSSARLKITFDRVSTALSRALSSI